jgi:hypothetical protein
MSTQRLLNIAERLCGVAARRKVFEPLIADWHREWLDARGQGRAQAALILCRGYLAFGFTLVACVNPLRTDAPPMSRFAAGFVTFALLGTAIMLLPITIRWSHWAFFSADVFWEENLGRWAGWLLYGFPSYFVDALSFAALPAAMVAAVSGASARRIVIGLSVAIGTAVAIHVAIVPAARHATSMRFWQQTTLSQATIEDRVARQEAAQLARLTNNRPTPFRILWGRTRQLDRSIAATIALTLLGLALGRARRAKNIQVTFRDAALWWAFGWVAYLMLNYWAGYIRPTIPIPRSAALWLPAAVLSFAAIAALRLTAVRRDAQTT